MKYRVIHRTEYEYSDTANVCHNIAHIAPRADTRQHCSSHFLSIVPQPSVIEERSDHFGNRLCYFSIEKPHRSMVVTATSLVDVRPTAGRPESHSTWRQFAADLKAMPPAESMAVSEFLLDSPMIPMIAELSTFAGPSFERHEGVLAAALDLMTRIHKEFIYDPSFTTLATPLRDVLLHKRGVCQDFAHLAIGCLRAHGLAARYMSGYLETLPPEGQEKLVGADASHAWLSVFVPDAGWIDLDPTNNKVPDERYIVLGWGRDYSDVPPLKGVIFGGGSPKMTVAVDVEPMK